MEGYLLKWAGVFSRWKMKYFLLKDGILTYHEQKDMPARGKLHLKICQIDLSPDDPLKLIVHSGTKQLLLRTANISEKIKWQNAMKQAQMDIQIQKESEQQQTKTLNNLGIFQKYVDQPNNNSRKNSFKIEAVKQMKLKQFNEDKTYKNYSDLQQILDNRINDVWEQQIKFDELLYTIQDKVDPESTLGQIIQQIDQQGQNLIEKITLCLKIMDEEKKKISKICKVLDQKLEKLEGIRINVDSGDMNNTSIQSHQNKESDTREINEIKQSDPNISSQNMSKLNLKDKLPQQQEQQINNQMQKIYNSDLNTFSNNKVKIKNFDSTTLKAQLFKSSTLHNNNQPENFNQSTYNDSINEQFKSFNLTMNQSNNMTQRTNNISKFRNNKQKNSTFNNNNESFVSFDDNTEHFSFQKPTVQDQIKNSRSLSFQQDKIDQILPKDLKKELEQKSQSQQDQVSIQSCESINQISNSIEQFQYKENWQDVLEYLVQTNQQQKYILLLKSQAFSQLQLKNQLVRHQLPVYRNQFEIVEFWSFIKEYFGKDFMKQYIPVELAEPISMLQRQAEQFEYAELIEKANKQESNSQLQMAYIMAFAISGYGNSHYRVRKPFDSLIGETFEYENTQKGYKFIAEQVNNQVIAMQCQSEIFTFQQNCELQTIFQGVNIQFNPVGLIHLRLNKQVQEGDHYIYNKPFSTVSNVMSNNPIVNNHGVMQFYNCVSQDQGILNVESRQWNGKNDFSVNGVIKNGEGEEIYHIKGQWNSKLFVIDIKTQQEILLWEINPQIENYNEQYCFTEFTINMNHLNVDTIKTIPITDSRYRPDIRALEYRNMNLASKLNKKLEEQNKTRVEQIESGDVQWKPKWFKEEYDQHSKQIMYVFNDEYWTKKLDDVPDILQYSFDSQ